MHPKLLQRFTAIEAERKALLAELVHLQEDILNYSPPGKWSVNQILMHLMTSERMSLIYMKKKSLGINNVGDSGVIESLKLLTLRVSQRLPFRFKAPQALVENTPEPLPLPQLMKKWDSARSNVYSFLETIQDQHIHKKIYKHPVVGRLDVMQAMVFFNEHIHHHWPQVKNLLKN